MSSLERKKREVAQARVGRDEYEDDVRHCQLNVRQSIEEDTERRIRRWNQVIIYEFHRVLRPISIRFRFRAGSPFVMKVTDS